MNITPVKTNFLNVKSGNITTKKDLQEKKLKDLCNEFEGIMLQQMLKGMKSKETMLDGGAGGDIFQDMYIENISKEMSKSSDFNFGEQLYKEFTKYDSMKENKLNKNINIKM